MATFGVQQRGLGGDRDRFRVRADFQIDIDANGLQRSNAQSVPQVFLEALNLDNELVVSRRQIADRELAGGSGRAGINLSGSYVSRLDRRVRDHRSGGV